MYYVRLSIANLAVSIGGFLTSLASLSPPPLPILVSLVLLSHLSRANARQSPAAANTRRRTKNKTEREKLTSLGICLGKFTKSGKFRLHITSLPILAEHARYKIWVKPNGEMPFLYGGNIVKAHVGRWSDDCPEHQGVIVYSMNDTPLGFGITARATAEARRLDPTGVVAFRQADCGEYLRDEDNLFASG